ncbi:cupin domain-containing protein [Candidimonas nitroreducens]|uniref:hypothetical protein n=1 Tax=Candidimonas nitroreducens TaxID=683354 RepID=UPI00117796EC|nr:hypothetical protein [Candidimonas nitroreducens]
MNSQFATFFTQSKSKGCWRALDGKGHETIVTRTTHVPGTRPRLHRHDYGGATCALDGKMTLYREGAAPKHAATHECYYMPANNVMAGVDAGTVNAAMLDIFQVPEG